VSDSISRVHFEAGPYVAIRDDGGAISSAGGVQVATERIVQLGGIWTREDRRREGLARAVVAELVRRVEAGGRMLALHVRVDNHAAVELYAGLGFRGRRRIRLYQFS
jgi:predicted GNAT family acetyltransferase